MSEEAPRAGGSSSAAGTPPPPAKKEELQSGDSSATLMDIDVKTSKEQQEACQIAPTEQEVTEMDTSASSLTVNLSLDSSDEAKSLEPKAKKIKLSATQRKLLAVEREKAKKERDELRAAALASKVEKEREKVEKEKERIKAMELKQKAKDDEKREKEAERERKAAEAAEKKLQLEKEKAEKLQQKEEERERKEREKVAKEKERLQQREAKEHERQRRLEEKKAEEDRKRLEEERKKEEEEKRLQKSRNVMYNFFHRKSKSGTEANGGGNGSSSTEASPVKLQQQQQQEFDLEAFKRKIAGQNVPEEGLYIKQLLAGKIKPFSAPSRKWSTQQQQNQQQQGEQTDDDCVLLDGEFADNQKGRTKEEDKIFVFLQFAENTRPAYFGRRFQPSPLVTLTGRTPFKKENYLEYEVDSDDEWEEEDPAGESLSGSESEAEKGAADKDDYEIDDDFFVPHGYLSEEETGLGDDSELDNSALAHAGGHGGPLMKEQALMAERSGKFTNKLTPQVVGCIWAADREASREQYDFLQQFKAVRIPLC